MQGVERNWASHSSINTIHQTLEALVPTFKRFHPVLVSRELFVMAQSVSSELPCHALHYLCQACKHCLAPPQQSTVWTGLTKKQNSSAVSVSRSQLTDRVRAIDEKVKQLLVHVDEIVRLQENVLNDTTCLIYQNLDGQISKFKAFESLVRADIDSLRTASFSGSFAQSILQIHLPRLDRKLEDVSSYFNRLRTEYQGRCREQIIQQQYLNADARGRLDHAKLLAKLEKAPQDVITRRKQIQSIEHRDDEVFTMPQDGQDVIKAASNQIRAVNMLGQGTGGIHGHSISRNGTEGDTVKQAPRIRKLWAPCFIPRPAVLALALGLVLVFVLLAFRRNRK